MIHSAIQIRTIQPSDNSGLAALIRDTMAEFGVNRPGTVYFDPRTDDLYQLFRTPHSIYYVAEQDGQLSGGAGIFPSPGLPEGVCELVKMYLQKETRGKGLGRLLIETCLESARTMGYKKIYLETMPELTKAISMYERFGFTFLRGPMGDTGHFGCEVWMIKEL